VTDLPTSSAWQASDPGADIVNVIRPQPETEYVQTKVVLLPGSTVTPIDGPSFATTGAEPGETPITGMMRSAGIPPVFVTVSATANHCPTGTGGGAGPDADAKSTAGATMVTVPDTRGPVVIAHPAFRSDPVTVPVNTTVPGPVST
jgi:hypothetical protein